MQSLSVVGVMVRAAAAIIGMMLLKTHRRPKFTERAEAASIAAQSSRDTGR